MDFEKKMDFFRKICGPKIHKNVRFMDFFLRPRPFMDKKIHIMDFSKFMGFSMKFMGKKHP